MLSIDSNSTCVYCNSHFQKNTGVKEYSLTDQKIKEWDFNDKTPIQVRCGHLFHRGCLYSWYNWAKETNYKCLDCKAVIVPENDPIVNKQIKPVVRKCIKNNELKEYINDNIKSKELLEYIK